MHRLLVPPERLLQDSPLLPKEAANHLRVLRPKCGEEIELFDGRGNWRRYLVDGDARNFALSASAPVESAPRPQWSLTLFACVTKGSRWDWTIEKATELGATRIVPVISERTIVRIGVDERSAKRERWMRIAEDAARQSDAKWLPEVCAPVAFAESLAMVRETTCFVGALATPEPPPIAAALNAQLQTLNSKLSLYIGPEGDFTPEELAELVEIATPVSFGSTVLRAETAAIFGLSVLKANLDVQSAF